MGDQERQGDVHNELSGHVAGPVGQFGTVHGDVYMHAPVDPQEAERRARHWERVERQWAEEDATRAAAEEEAERLRRAREEEPAVRWRNENAARLRKVTRHRNETLIFFGVGVAGVVAASLTDLGLVHVVAVFGSFFAFLFVVPSFIGYVVARARYRLWRGW